MTKRKPLLTGKPHDSYFKAVFQVPELADQLIRYALPPDILIELYIAQSGFERIIQI